MFICCPIALCVLKASGLLITDIIQCSELFLSLRAIVRIQPYGTLGSVFSELFIPALLASAKVACFIVLSIQIREFS